MKHKHMLMIAAGIVIIWFLMNKKQPKYSLTDTSGNYIRPAGISQSDLDNALINSIPAGSGEARRRGY